MKVQYFINMNLIDIKQVDSNDIWNQFIPMESNTNYGLIDIKKVKSVLQVGVK